MGIIHLQVLCCQKLSDQQDVSELLLDILTLPERESILLRTVEVGRGNTH